MKPSSKTDRGRYNERTGWYQENKICGLMMVRSEERRNAAITAGKPKSHPKSTTLRSDWLEKTIDKEYNQKRRQEKRRARKKTVGIERGIERKTELIKKRRKLTTKPRCQIKVRPNSPLYIAGAKSRIPTKSSLPYLSSTVCPVTNMNPMDM